jgi:hypothetical protein
MEQKKGKGRPSKGNEKRKQYNGTLEPIKIEVIGGTKECNHLAYEHLTKVYKNKLKNETKEQ